jgi:NADPH:quinone reductase-like Zn-dependent oxidoreductase
MRCVVFTGTGGGEVVSVQARAVPQPGKFEVLIATLKHLELSGGEG